MNVHISVSLCASLLVGMFVGTASAQHAEPIRLHVNGVNLAYIEQGHGAPLILLHGGIGDYSSWRPQLNAFSKHFRVIAYSRRFSFPNNNPSIPKNYSPWTDVQDLEALIRKLNLHNVRIVGQSAGAFVALAYASQHPSVVRGMVLSEPPAHQLIRNTSEGNAAYEHFISTVMAPAADSFKRRDVQNAMATFVNGMAATNRYDSLSIEARSELMRNARSVEALALSADPFPALDRNQLSRLPVATLIVTGESTIEIHKLVDKELIRILPNVKSVIIPHAGHGSPRENSSAFNDAVLSFFGDVETAN